jgi:hypothetical protein
VIEYGTIILLDCILESADGLCTFNLDRKDVVERIAELQAIYVKRGVMVVTSLGS